MGYRYTKKGLYGMPWWLYVDRALGLLKWYMIWTIQYPGSLDQIVKWTAHPLHPPSLRPEALVICFLGCDQPNLAGTLHIGRNWFGPLDELFQNDVTTLKFTPCSVERSCRFWLLKERTKKNNKIVNPCKSHNKSENQKVRNWQVLHLCVESSCIKQDLLRCTISQAQPYGLTSDPAQQGACVF